MKKGWPFSGNSGHALREMMEMAGLNLDDCYQTLIFKQRPPDGKLDAWCCNKDQLPPAYSLPPVFGKRYLAPEHTGKLSESLAELEGLASNLIVALGGTAAWALGISSISQSRGVVTTWRGRKILPVYSPQAIFTQYNLRTITITDLIKAEYESHFPEVRRPERELWIQPTLQEVQEFFRRFIDTATEVSLDIENPGGTLNCIALSPSESLSLCIPFLDRTKPDNCYWTSAEEAVIWRLLRHLLITRTINRTVRTIGQNLIYDVQHLDRQVQCRLASIDDDAMLAHHAMFPEMQKGLGFLASVYTNELSWKDIGKELWKDK